MVKKNKINTDQSLKGIKVIEKGNEVEKYYPKQIVGDTRMCSVKMVFLKISQNPQENTCARDVF